MIDIKRIEELLRIIDSPPENPCSKHFSAIRQLEFLAVPIARDYVYLRAQIKKLSEEEREYSGKTLEITIKGNPNEEKAD